jgi:exodeoxyribonuclease III
MSDFQIATWNVNSLRVRGEQLMEWLRAVQPDVVALQETKMQDPDFPAAAFTAAGYHCVFSGQKTYNGVALLSKLPMTDIVRDIPDFDDPPRRVLAATIGRFRAHEVAERRSGAASGARGVR